MALFNYECDEVKRIIQEVSPNYPQLTTYEKEWLFFYKYGYSAGIPVELEYEKVVVNPYGSIENAIPHNYKSAILKGQTLVNVHPSNYIVSGNNTTFFFNKLISKTMIKPNTRYFLRLYNTHQSIVKAYFKPCVNNNVDLSSDNKCAIFTTKSELTDNDFKNNKIHFYSSSALALEDVKDTKVILCEYVDGMENLDIPYFESMQSVKMPVLTTTGKNLICVGRGDNNSVTINGVTITTDVVNQTITFNGTSDSNNISQSLDSLFNQKIKKDERYALSCYLVSGNADRVMFRANASDWSNSMSCEVNTPQYKTFNKDVTYDVCSFRIDSGATFNHAVFKVMFERIDVNSNTTSYEPFKSNILTVNEEVELRGTGDVKDKLNLLTGELTQYCEEVIFDGSGDEKWNYDSTSSNFYIQHDDMMKLPDYLNKLSCNYLPTASHHKVTDESEYITGYNVTDKYPNQNWLYVKINNITTVNDFKNYLQSNPIHLIYPLANPTVKTVDLTKLTKPYEGTNNYHLSSDSPCEVILEVPVVSTGKQTLKEINN